ncbi:hypothetical protein FA13DRAFT_65838 [Coprinellus micaceus]|uniref:Uncharacterized protein n=1 Tax=Coprinellus micaceus TaxID=71717 RepID=A0A4Y7TIR2_COPMI|nr:hypothetical protein FA13DRAFT_65838 [Coprinellus micaceus]
MHPMPSTPPVRVAKQLTIIVPPLEGAYRFGTVDDGEHDNVSTPDEHPNTGLYVPVHKREGWYSPYDDLVPLSPEAASGHSEKPVEATASPATRGLFPVSCPPLRQYDRDELLGLQSSFTQTYLNIKAEIQKTCPEILFGSEESALWDSTPSVEPPSAPAPKRHHPRSKRPSSTAAEKNSNQGKSEGDREDRVNDAQPSASPHRWNSHTTRGRARTPVIRRGTGRQVQGWHRSFVAFTCGVSHVSNNWRAHADL